MDNLVFLLSEPCPTSIINRSIRATQILDSAADEFGCVSQYGEGKTELTVVLRGPRRREATEMLRQCEVGIGVERTPHLPLGHGKCKCLHVVCGYKNLGAMATAAQQFDPEAAARAASASSAESASFT